MIEKVRILFVCMGNICRSPAAQGVFEALVRKAGLEDRIEIDSAGTIGFHAGSPADDRMSRSAARRGLELTSRARRVEAADLERFDYVLACDPANYADLHRLDPGGSHHAKIRLLTDYHPEESVTEVPDPYYGGEAGFELVLDILEVACANLLEDVKKDLDPEGAASS